MRSRSGIVLLLLIAAGGCAVAPPAPDAFRDCADCPEMVVVPAGRFLMGSDPGEDRWEGGREDPQHEVHIARSFALGRYEVTRAQFAQFVEETGYAANGCAVWNGESWHVDAGLSWRDPGYSQTPDDPVVCVAWLDAKAYLAWLSVRTGRAYRLPSEAEWEYAARAGTTTARYWGERADDGCRYANIGDAALKRRFGFEGLVDCDDGQVFTSPVGRYRPNAFGLYDMLGNAWEWTEDCWNVGYAGAPADGSPWASGDCADRVPRGASWNSHQRNVRSANRGNYRASLRFYHLGFRVARDLPR
jgi:formylglycine-generating enzyme required for sulfatase activity